MPEGSFVAAAERLEDAIASYNASLATASGDDLLSGLVVIEGASESVAQARVATVGKIDREGVFATKNVRSTAHGIADLLGWEYLEARRHVVAAQHVTERFALDGIPLPPKLPTMAALFMAGQARQRHVDVMVGLLDSPTARRLSSQYWALAEEQIGHAAPALTPAELRSWGRELIELLDQDGAEPDDRDRRPVNDVRFTPRDGGGGTMTGSFDDAEMYAAIRTAVEAKSGPLSADDKRLPAERQAAALADICGFVLDHGDTPKTGGHRPHVTVLIGLDDLTDRARSASLDLGEELTPAQMRRMACDANVLPVVLGSEGEPLDVGHDRRTIPEPMRRAVAARDRGCAHPGCTRPPSWCEVHHIIEWQHGGATCVENLVMLCRVHHRQIHDTDWTVRIRNGHPEFVPPPWVDPVQIPRQRPRRITHEAIRKALR